MISGSYCSQSSFWDVGFMSGYRWRCCATKCVVELNWDVGGGGALGALRDTLALGGTRGRRAVSASHSIDWRSLRIG